MANDIPEGFTEVQRQQSDVPEGFQEVQRVPPMSTGARGDEEARQPGTFRRILDAFNHGYEDTWGTKKLGQWADPILGPPVSRMTKEQLDHPVSFMKSFNETWIRPIAWGTDAALRAIVSPYPAAQQMGVQIGEEIGQRQLARDLVSLPDAFMGSIGALARPRTPLERAITQGERDLRAQPRVTGGPQSDLGTQINAANDLKIINTDRPDITVGTPREAAVNIAETPRSLGPTQFEATLTADGKVVTNAPVEGKNVIVHADPQKLMTVQEFEKFFPGVTPEEYGMAKVHAGDGKIRLVDVRSIRDASEMTEPLPGPKSAGAAATPKELIPPEPKMRVATDKAGNIRLDLITTQDEAMAVLRKSAEENGGFAQARAGDMPLASRQAVAEVMGMDVSKLPDKAMRNLDNPELVRSFITGMINSAEEVADLMKRAKISGKIEDLMELQQALMRHDVIQEGVAGLTAEWGRTGNVFQEFADKVKDAQGLGRWLKEKKGRSLDDLRQIAQEGAALDPRTQLPRFLQDLRKPTRLDKAAYYWVNSVLSGLGSQSAYFIADSMFALMDTALTTPVAAGVGAVRKVFNPSRDRVYFGEAMQKGIGYIHGFPDAVVAFGEAIKNDVRTPLPGKNTPGLDHVTWGEIWSNVPKLLKDEATGADFTGVRGAASAGVNPITGQRSGVTRPIGGTLGAVVGTPSRALGGIQSFFEYWNYSAKMYSEAYRKTIQSGAELGTPAFAEKMAQYRAFPTEDMMATAFSHAEYMTYVEPLGPKGKLRAAAIANTQGGQFIVPFTHVPPNVAKIAVEHSPVAWMGTEIRKDLLGKNGPIAQDTAFAKMIIGSSFGAFMVSLALQGRLTGDPPTDPDQAAQWLLTNKPTSIRIGDEWWDYRRLGMPALLMRQWANIADVGRNISEDEYAEALFRTVVSGKNFITDSGLSTMSELVQAMNDPGKHFERFASQFAASWMPFSSAGYQIGNSIDPLWRDTEGFVAALKSKVPILSRTNDPKLNWLGEEQANPRFGSGMTFPHSVVSTDPLNVELQRLDINPAHMKDSIHGVQLRDRFLEFDNPVNLGKDKYDELQRQFGVIARPMLEGMMQNETWATLDDGLRKKVMQGTISAARQLATTYIMMKYWDELAPLIIEAKTDAAMGNTPKPGTYRRPQ